MNTNTQFRLVDFNVYNGDNTNQDSGEDEYNSDGEQIISPEQSTFKIQMFGINEQGETCSIIAEDYKPFFYVKVPIL